IPVAVIICGPRAGYRMSIDSSRFLSEEGGAALSLLSVGPDVIPQSERPGCRCGEDETVTQRSIERGSGKTRVVNRHISRTRADEDNRRALKQRQIARNPWICAVGG